MNAVDQIRVRDIRGSALCRLLAHSLDRSRLWCLQNPDYCLTPPQAERFYALKNRLDMGEPISKILGQRSFWKDDFLTTPDVLDPRPDSETLITAVLNHYPDRGGAYRLLDLGTGSGCLLLSLMGEYQNACGVGVDLSSAALGVAKNNGENLGRFPLWVQGNWGESLKGPFDIIISNPPYIPTKVCETLEVAVRVFDPMMALDGGPDGLQAYQVLMRHIKRLLAPAGMAFLEIGDTQAEAVSSIAQKKDLKIHGIEKDLENRDRCVIVSL
jgi:release factor glutamine methyltransferase